MLAHLRKLSASTARPIRATCYSRQISCTSVRRAAEVEDSKAEGKQQQDLPTAPTDPEYETWLDGPGKQFRDPHRPRNWLGGQVPFPLNPTFKPPTPVSDELRSIIYTFYMANPAVNGVRALAERYGLSIKRVDAILRLKGLEEHWKKRKPLQTGFLAGMEEILGVAQDRQLRRGALTRGVDELGDDASEADLQSETEGNDEARHRYQRMFWEPVLEGREPVVPAALEKARAYTEKHIQAADAAKSDPALLATHSGSHEDRTHIVEREGRPTVRFVDVGGKFLDVADIQRRAKEGERRSKVRAKRRERKVAALIETKQKLAH